MRQEVGRTLRPKEILATRHANPHPVFLSTAQWPRVKNILGDCETLNKLEFFVQRYRNPFYRVYARLSEGKSIDSAFCTFFNIVTQLSD